MNKVAICIGISEYDFALGLKNPVNDANDMNVKLIELGFNVSLVENQNRIEIIRAIIHFKKKAKDSDVTLIYYAGHGIQNNGVNYLIPKDANPQTESEIDIFCIRIDELVSQDALSENKTNILIFDACRNNPFSRTWNRSSSSSGFAPILAPSGTLIAFSTSPGKTASDGVNDNGLYTDALLNEIAKPDLSIIQVFQNVRQKVLYTSYNNQLPWESTSLLGYYYFNPLSFNPTDLRIITIRKQVAKINESTYRFDKKEIDVMDESTEGGSIYSYSENEQLKKLEKQLFFESGRYFQDVFIENDNPIYYRISKHEYNVPFSIDSELAAEIGLESFDESKTKICIDEYFIYDSIIIGVNKISDKKSIELDKKQSVMILNEIETIITQGKIVPNNT